MVLYVLVTKEQLKKKKKEEKIPDFLTKNISHTYVYLFHINIYSVHIDQCTTNTYIFLYTLKNAHSLFTAVGHYYVHHNM